jgi:transposase
MQLRYIQRKNHENETAWFGRMLENHFDGIIAHARFRISAGKIEDINNRIKTIRRMGYGYPDDEYFFLKLIDMSRSKDA